MNELGSIDRDLEILARAAAIALRVPFVTVTVGDDADTDDSVMAKAVFADAEWATAHGDVDLVGLDNARAVAHNIPFYACVPVRNDAGRSVGRVCCGSGEERDLTDADLDRLKRAASEVATRIKGQDAQAAFVRV